MVVTSLLAGSLTLGGWTPATAGGHASRLGYRSQYVWLPHLHMEANRWKPTEAAFHISATPHHERQRAQSAASLGEKLAANINIIFSQHSTMCKEHQNQIVRQAATSLLLPHHCCCSSICLKRSQSSWFTKARSSISCKTVSSRMERTQPPMPHLVVEVFVEVMLAVFLAMWPPGC